MLKIVQAATALLALMSFSPAMASTPWVEYFPHPGGKPFSQAVRVGNFVYVSGTTGRAADGTYPDDFSVQAVNAMEAQAAELTLAGATWDDVFRCRVALTDMDDWDAFNAVYRKYFKPDRLPARMAIAVVSLGGSDVEIQCEAFLTK